MTGKDFYFDGEKVYSMPEDEILEVGACVPFGSGRIALQRVNDRLSLRMIDSKGKKHQALMLGDVTGLYRFTWRKCWKVRDEKFRQPAFNEVLVPDQAL